MQIDITFDFRTDCSHGQDPDKYSSTLRKYHEVLWSKPLPNGEMFEIRAKNKKTYLHHKSHLGEFFLSSDSVIPSFNKWKRLAHIIEDISEPEREEFVRMSYTIGGMMIFPGNRINGKPTINGERGFNRKIGDRMDLTLECIRRHYLGLDNPMGETLQRHSQFFRLFADFRGYVDFFFLNDLVKEDYSAVTLFLPNDDFNSSPLPGDLQAYVKYRNASISFVQARNQRIASSCQV